MPISYGTLQLSKHIPIASGTSQPDGKTESPLYFLDTRGDKLLSYLDHMMKLAGIELISRTKPDSDSSLPKPESRCRMSPLIDRERQVAELHA